MGLSQKTYDELADLARRMYLSLYNHSPESREMCRKAAEGYTVNTSFLQFIPEKMEYDALPPNYRRPVRALIACNCAAHEEKSESYINPTYLKALKTLNRDKTNPKQENKMPNMSADFTKPVQSFTRIFGIETSDLSEEQIIDLIRKAQAEAESYKDLTRSTKIAKRVDQIEIGIKALYALLDGE